MASHFPPPEKDGGGAAATASSTACISAATLSSSPSRKSMAGTGRAGSSSLWRWKKWISHGSGTGVTTGQRQAVCRHNGAAGAADYTYGERQPVHDAAPVCLRGGDPTTASQTSGTTVRKLASAIFKV